MACSISLVRGQATPPFSILKIECLAVDTATWNDSQATSGQDFWLKRIPRCRTSDFKGEISWVGASALNVLEIRIGEAATRKSLQKFALPTVGFRQKSDSQTSQRATKGG